MQMGIIALKAHNNKDPHHLYRVSAGVNAGLGTAGAGGRQQQHDCDTPMLSMRSRGGGKRHSFADSSSYPKSCWCCLRRAANNDREGGEHEEMEKSLHRQQAASEHNHSSQNNNNSRAIDEQDEDNAFNEETNNNSKGSVNVNELSSNKGSGQRKPSADDTNSMKAKSKKCSFKCFKVSSFNAFSSI
jgi:hypothetical protein